MQKGKFGFRTWLYPFIALWGMLVGPEWLPFAVLGFVLVMEQDQWAGRQCFRVILFQFYWLFYGTITDLILAIPVVGLALAVPFGIIHFILYIVLLVAAFTLGLGRLKSGKELSIPGGKVTDMAYERIQAAVVNYAPPPQGYQQPQYPPQYQQAPPPQYQQPQAPQQPQSPPPPQNDGFIPPPPPPPTPGGQQ